MAAVPVRSLSPSSIDSLDTLSRRLVGAVTAGPLSLTTALTAAAEQLAPELSGQVLPPPDGMVVLRGLPMDADSMGPTPGHWSNVSPALAAGSTAQLLLLALAAGRPIGWQGQQDGRLVHDILPTRGHELMQTGASSAVALSPHTEDAFHPARADLLMLGCVRNPDAVATSAASIRHVQLADADRALLARRVLPILPDDAYDQAQRFDGAAPPPVATLWAGESGPCLRYDPAYTPLLEDAEYAGAYQRLAAELDRVSVAVRLEPGDVLVIDNDVVVHGREPFPARYDGTDRWLRRASVRLPDRHRPAAEATEHGYGQRVLDPFAA